MNIFWLDLCLETCARYHCDKHVVKMILELAQMLYTAHWENNVSGWEKRSTKEIGLSPYKKTHINHPCTIWVRESRENYLETANLGIELCKEYTRRYKKVHKTEQHIRWLQKNIPDAIPSKGLTPKPLAMPVEYQMKGDTVQSYRIYYLNDKEDIAKWKYTEKPSWYYL